MSRDRDTVTSVTAVTDIGPRNVGPARDTVLVGKYRVEHTIGVGGMGLVVRAHNIQLDEKVAIKFIREDVDIDDGHVERFLREAKAAVRLKSEHVARIRDVGTLENGRPYIVMEMLDGVDLGQLLDDMGSLPVARSVDLMLQTCDAIAEAHSLGIIHRDIKPTNLFLTRRRDDTELLKVLDFGISKAQQGPQLALTQTSSMLGTPAYMSPEQMRSARDADPRSDIWAIGVVIYELVEGRPPFRASNFAELCVLVTTEPPDPLVKAPELAHVIERCLAKSVADRYQDVAELAADLEIFASDPERARRQVNRITRVLGKPVPAARDSGQRITRRSATAIPQTPGRHSTGLAMGATPDRSAIPDLRSRGRGIQIGALLVVLFGIGIAGGLYVSRDDTPLIEPTAADPADPAARGDHILDPMAATSDAASAAAVTTVVDGIVTDAAADARPGTSSVGEHAGSGSADDSGSGGGTLASDAEQALDTIPPPRRQPPKRQPLRRVTTPPREVAPPPPSNEPAVTPPEPPVVPPKVCDPFSNKDRCN